MMAGKRTRMSVLSSKKPRSLRDGNSCLFSIDDDNVAAWRCVALHLCVWNGSDGIIS